MSTYVFGDIQGCFDEFSNLLDIVDYDSSNDHLWFVGDLINRGPKNLQTLEFIMSQEHVVTVLGNHDLHFLAIATGCHDLNAKDTVSDLLTSPCLPEIIDWLRSQPLIHHDAQTGIVMVHAGLPPIWDIETSLSHAREVEAVIQSDNSFFQEMYGNEPDQWQHNLSGSDRLRVITNYFTRMRFCTVDGKLELTHKDKAPPDGFSPWYNFARPDTQSLRILFGHWASLGGFTGNDSAIALDTGCVWGRNLTTFRLDDSKFFSTPSLSIYSQD